MINSLIVAARIFLRQRTQSFLNVSGLAIGLACSIYAYLYVYDELTYDKQHPNADNTYRLVWKTTDSEQNSIAPWAIQGWAHYMQENLKGVTSYSSLRKLGWPHSFYYTPEDGHQKIVISDDVIYGDENYQDFFYLDLVAGDKNKLLEQPTDILISESAARELFGDEVALNKELEFSHPIFLGKTKTSVVVKGIFRDMPYNVQFGRTTKYILNRALRKTQFEKQNSSLSFENSLTAMWWPGYFACIYFQVEPNADLDFLKEKLKIKINEVAPPEYPHTIEPIFLKITETHFSEIPNLIHPELPGNRQYIYIFLTIGVFILLISCINYINLTTAQSMQRAKEVGMRKVMGCQKMQLVFQFLQEALLVTGLSVIIALIIAIVLLPYFSDFVNKDFMASDIFSAPSAVMIVLLWLIVSMLSGLYPSFYVASMEVTRIMKGASSFGKGGSTLRQGLTVFQFTISLILMVFTLVVIRQMDQMMNKDLNKAGDQILSIRYGMFAPVNKLEVFRNELAKIPGLSFSTHANHLPRREGSTGFTPLSFETRLPDKLAEKHSWDMICIGADFHKVFDLELVAGHFFDSSAKMDSMEILVNEESARQLNMEVTEILGQQILVKNKWSEEEKSFTVRGVFKDFKYKSAYNKLSPLILSIQQDHLTDLVYYVRLPEGDIQNNVAAIERAWRKVMPEDVGISYWFLSDEFNKLYFEETALHNLSTAFTVLGIITTCIGLFGMSIFVAERRSKEMAIRKVMGADPANVLRMMVVPFLKLMMGACVIGLPLAYYLSGKWLDNFTYKVEWSWTMAVLSVLLILAVTLFTISFQSVRSANANPVNSLRE